MVQRVYPSEYFTNNNNFTKWLPIIVIIALLGSFAVAIYAISKVK